MKKIILLTLASVLLSVASFALAPITGAITTCIGTSASVHDIDTPGVWSSSNTAVATITSLSGDVYGVSAGTVTITFTAGGAYVTETFTVAGTLPAPITGITTMCVGATSTLSDATLGGTWSSGSTYYATVGSTTGIVTGVHSGSAVIYYNAGGCNASAGVTIPSAPLVYLTGPLVICVGSTGTITDSSGGGSGVWSSATTAIATVGSTGIVTGVSPGTDVISYTVTGACGTTTGTRTITVSNTTSPGTISGASSIFIGATASFYDGVSGGTWSSSNTTVATVDPASGVVTGVSSGTATISYTVIGCGGSAYTTAPITVTPFTGISGHILFTHGGYGGYYDTLKVWLITYNPGTSMLEAIDSVSLTTGGSTSIYYQFLGEPSDSFRMKAALMNDSFTYYGYMPTYHTSSFYWDSATVLSYTAGTGAINQDITMLWGLTTSGPGFIAGNVTMGANKGTSTAIPSVGLQMYCINSTTGAMVQQTTTDGTGNYIFSNLPLGTYTIFPEALNYLTTAYTNVTLTSSSYSKTATSFIQHTLSRTITPIIPESVSTINPKVASVFAYPNPTSGKLNIQWQEPTAEKASVTISDITGRELFRSSIDMNQGSGMGQVDLSELSTGLYMISIKSAAISYNNKIQVQH